MITAFRWAQSLCLILPGLFVAAAPAFGRHRRRLALFSILFLVGLLPACGGGNGANGGGAAQPGTPTGQYTITVTATMGSISHHPDNPVVLNIQ